MSPPLLQATGLQTYYGTSHVLQGVDLAVHEGEAVALLGRNGMGKTTTIRSLAGLTPPREGSVTFAGEDVTDRPPFEVARLGLGLALGLTPRKVGVQENVSDSMTLLRAKELA